MNGSQGTTQTTTPYGIELLIGSSRVMQGVRNYILSVAPVDVPVLIVGETGTGKDLVARALYTHSRRTTGPFLHVNCAAISQPLIESALFGYVHGAFSGAIKGGKQGYFEAANHGVIFLDEFTELPLDMQARLLVVLQNKEFMKVGDTKTHTTNARVIAAMPLDVEEATRQKKLHEAIKYRLNGITIHLPPLRERGEDVRELAEYFLAKHVERYNRQISLEDGAWRFIDSYKWPGNVRQLSHTIEAAVVRFGEESKPARLSSSDLESILRVPSGKSADGITVQTPNAGTEPSQNPEIAAGGILYKDDVVVYKLPVINADTTIDLKDVGRGAAWAAQGAVIERVLKETRWNRVEAARRLNISYKALLYKIAQLGKERKESR